MQKRVAVIALLQESNTFLPHSTRLEHFQQDVFLTGEAIRQRFAGAHHELAGFFSGLEEAGVEAVPIFAARALPYGVIEADTWRQLMDTMFEAVDRAGPFDGALIAPHGATVSAPEPDADGYWMNELRSRLGPSLPIIGTIDPHCNLSVRMVQASTALIAYRTNPHVDQFSCGLQAARLMARTLRGEVRPTQAAAFPPVVINIERQNSLLSPCRELYVQADRLLERPGVLADSVVLGFAYADVHETGSSMLVVTDNDPPLAQQLADELAETLWANREQFVAQLISVDEAVRQVTALEGPICLLDMGDNVGGGSPADGTWLAHALHEQQIAGSFVCLFDPDAVARCAAAGSGQSLRMPLGGHSGRSSGEPLNVEFRIIGLHCGQFRESEPRHGGFTTFDQGPTAVVQTDSGLTIMLTSRRMAPFSLAQLTSCDLDPSAFRVLVAKGVVAPMAAYQSVCRHFIRVNTPGVTTADLAQLDYRHRRRPLFPLERDFDWKAQSGGRQVHSLKHQQFPEQYR